MLLYDPRTFLNVRVHVQKHKQMWDFIIDIENSAQEKEEVSAARTRSTYSRNLCMRTPESSSL